MKRVCMMFAAFFVLLGLVTQAAMADKPLELKFEKYTLTNGMDVILHEDHSIPVVAVNIWYHVGSKNEKRGQTGFAHLFEHMMFKGSEHYDGEYNLEKIGGDSNGETNKDYTAYYEKVPSNYLELALAMESDRLGFLLPALTQKKLDNQRDVVKNEHRLVIENRPYGKAWELIYEMMYPENHPYSWFGLGSMEDLSAATLEDVSSFFKSFYTPNNASLAIAGDFDLDTAKKLVDKYFGTLPPGPPMERMIAWIPELDGVKRAVAEDNVELPRLYYTWHSPARYTPGDAELNIFADILGSGKTSRLQKALVYEQQITQDVSVYQNSCELGSLFYVQVTARKGHTQEDLEKAVDTVLQKILTDGITKAELSQVKINREVGFVRSLQRINSGRAGLLNEYNVFLGDPGKLSWDMERYAKATVEDVQRCARKYIDLNKRAILYITPQGKLTAGNTMVDRTKEPSAKTEPAFTPPKIQRATLANGLEILLVEDHRFPLVHLNIVIKSGFAADPTDRFGAAALTSELLDEGTKTRTTLEITEEARRLGAEFGTGSGFDDLSISLNVLKKNLDPALDLMADIVINPTFPEKELERQRQIYLSRILQGSKDPYYIANKAFMRILYGSDHPYGRGSGTESSLKAITRIDLVNFYKAYYVPGNAAAVIAGDITLSEAKQKLEKTFKKWEKGTVTARSVQTPQAPASTKIYLIDKPGAAQSVIYIGNLAMQRSNPDYLAFQVMNNAFGGQFTSRIFLNLREDKGYAYGAGSEITSARSAGSFKCGGSVDTQHTRESLTEMVREMRDLLGSRPLTDVELADSKNNLIKNFPQQFQDYSGIAGQLSTLIKFDLPLDEWNTYIERVGAITGAMANKAARDYLHPDALVIVIVGDREKIEEGIRTLNLGEIVYMDAVK